MMRLAITLSLPLIAAACSSDRGLNAPDRKSEQIESSEQYRAGYSRGHAWGTRIAQTPGGEPNFETASRLGAILGDSPSKGRESWRKGWVTGARAGYREIQPSSRNDAAYEPVSAANAAKGVKLYAHSEVHEATIVSVDVKTDKMIVRYEKNGAVEPKSISALSAYWFVRK